MPVFFWNDEDGSKYQKAYFSKFPGVWSHGDYCQINKQTGGMLMLGRSDGVLNPNGVRFGSAEIYSIVEGIQEIEDSVCVAQRERAGSEERVILFLKLHNGFLLDEQLLKKVRTEIRQLLSARHVPAVILQTADIPYTISGKKVELAVRDVIAGVAVKHLAAFRNPDSLELYKDIPELQDY
ncbi:AACS [Bugula neritina]|uniref:AACS n=1 Tax=Bugula neritina TaxID=10212 RepID=A0A7J7JZA6_BUGNE|nr:AACS [Bugula neritina]